MKLKKTTTGTFNFLLEAYGKDVELIACVFGTRGFQQKQRMGKVMKEQADLWWQKTGELVTVLVNITNSTRTLFIHTQRYSILAYNFCYIRWSVLILVVPVYHGEHPMCCKCHQRLLTFQQLLKSKMHGPGARAGGNPTAQLKLFTYRPVFATAGRSQLTYWKSRGYCRLGNWITTENLNMD